jgi:hypothetical protein
MEGNRISKIILHTNFETTRLRCRPRNRWQDEVREGGRVVGGEEWQENYRTERKGRSSCEQQGTIALCTWQME